MQRSGGQFPPDPRGFFLEIMQANIETIGALERRLDLSVPQAEIAAEVNQRLTRLARETSMPGFRRGKVPLKLIAQAHGSQVQAEVLNDKVARLLESALEQNRLRLAGRPQIEATAGDAALQTFRATFEVYPEIGPIDVSALAVERATCAVGEVEIDKILEVMRRQRGSFTPAARAARDGDRVTLDFRGTIDGVAFDGGTASGYTFELGAGRMLPQFEEATRGAAAGTTRRFPLQFPADYHGVEVAGKTAEFEITVVAVEERILPALDADFARSVGIGDGNLATLRSEVTANVEREVAMRLRARTRDSVMGALDSIANFELPRALVAEERERLSQIAQAEISARGGKEMPDPQVFTAAAERRVRMSLVVGEIVRSQGLRARPDQVQKALENIARGYERPNEVVQWYLNNRERLDEVEASVVEDNVVEWVLQRARTSERVVPFDDLMETAKG